MALYTGGSNTASPSLQKVNGIEESIIVKINSIDRLINEGTIPYPTVIKMDIEGAEMMALKGMTELLISEKRPRVVYIEIHPDFLPSFETSSEEIFKYLSQFRYVVIENECRGKQILYTLKRID